jgi:tetratricopeptide (TPR) repeat protein
VQRRPATPARIILAVDALKAESLLASVVEARTALRGPDGGAAQARLERMYRELASAFEFFLAERRADGALRLTNALVPFWMATSRIGEGDDWFQRALAADGSSERARARALYEYGYLIFWAGDYDRAGVLARQAVELGRAANEPTTAALALAVLARIALQADVEQAKRLLLEAIEVTDGTDDREGRSSAMHVLGVAYQMSGEFEEARRVMSDRIALGRETGNDYLVAIESANLSMVERQLGNLEHAEALARESLDIMRRRGDELAIPWVVNSLAAVTAARGDLPRSAILLGFAEAGISRAGGEWPPDERAQYEGTLVILGGGLASGTLDQARADGAAMAVEDGVAFALSASSAVAPAG